MKYSLLLHSAEFRGLQTLRLKSIIEIKSNNDNYTHLLYVIVLLCVWTYRMLYTVTLLHKSNYDKDYVNM